MADFGERLKNYIRSRSPRARLAAHREYWGENPPPKIADMMDNIESWLERGGGPKVVLTLAQLDHLRTINEWETDPDTVRGEKQLENAQRGGRQNAKRNWRPHAAEMQAAIDAKAAESPQHSYSRLRQLVKESHGYPDSALKRYTVNPYRKR